MTQPGRVYTPGWADEEAWRKLGEHAIAVATGGSRGVIKLRELRDAANRAVILGAEGDDNVCRQLLRVVSQRTDPRFAGQTEIDRRMARVAGEVLQRCDGFRAVREAARKAGRS